MAILFKIIIFALAGGSLLGGSPFGCSFDTVINLKTAIMNKKKKAIYDANYRHSKKGLLIQIFHNQEFNSKRRNHLSPIYSREEFIQFALSSPEFHILHYQWQMKDYNKMFAPTFDRANDYLGYSFDNFNKWMTWRKNKEKGHRDRKNGINNKRSRTVISIHKITGIKSEFHSTREAERVTGIPNQNISACCRKDKRLFKRNNKLYEITIRSAGDYYWSYKLI